MRRNAVPASTASVYVLLCKPLPPALPRHLQPSRLQLALTMSYSFAISHTCRVILALRHCDHSIRRSMTTSSQRACGSCGEGDMPLDGLLGKKYRPRLSHRHGLSPPSHTISYMNTEVCEPPANLLTSECSRSGPVEPRVRYVSTSWQRCGADMDGDWYRILQTFNYRRERVVAA